MKKAISTGTKTYLAGLVFVLIFSSAVLSQKKIAPPQPSVKPTPTAVLPKVKQIDEAGLKTALTPNGKPLLVNFWATWCDPCREEFPELVQIDAAYKGKIDFITISLDDLAEITRDVPKFLSDMKAEMPAYLLKVADEGAAISTIAKDWNGGLPFTVLYNPKGEVAYLRQGKVKVDVVKAEIDKLLPQPTPAGTVSKTRNAWLFGESPEDYEKGKTDALADISKGYLFIRKSGLGSPYKRIYARVFKEKYGVSVIGRGCMISDAQLSYDKGYNEISSAEIIKRFGANIFTKVSEEVNAQIVRPFANIDEITLTVNYKP